MTTDTRGSLRGSLPCDTPPSRGAATGGTAEEQNRGRTCPDCEGTGVVEYAVIRKDRRASVLAMRTEPCMGCFGRGVS